MVIFNPSKDFFTIDSIRVHKKKDVKGYGIYPSFREVSKPPFQLEPNKSFRREIKPDRLSSYFMGLKTPTKIYFRIDTSEGKIFKLRKELKYFYYEKERYMMRIR